MKDVENMKARDLQKPVPGCMGRMINMFDLSSGMAGTKLLTERAHRDGPPKFRTMDPIRARKEDTLISLQMTGGMRGSSRKSGGIPMKMLIAKEMSKEAGCNQMPPNIVAKLMGLDAAPVEKSVLNVKRSLNETYPCSTLAGAGGYQQKEDCCYDDQMPDEIQSSAHVKDDKDVRSVCHKPQKTNRIEDQPPQKGTCNESLTEKRMALVRQKFIEAKHLATDEKLIRSKEFQDALEILSSNRDLFLKFLDEPNSLSSEHLDEFQNVIPLSQPRRITVLKPARIVELQNDKQRKKERYTSHEEGGWEISKQCWSSSFSRRKAENVSNPTRIVVLKPSLLNSDETKNMAACPIPSSKLLDGRDSFVGTETTERVGSRELSKEITHTLRESVKGSQRDEALLSSLVMSNQYMGDSSSFNGSTDFKEDSSNLSDSEIVTPTPHHSCDCSDRLDSPHSVSSLSLASYSSESSVVREAKKRLSERWELVASNDNHQEQRQGHRSSSTLGEMLAIPQVKKEESDGLIASSNNSHGREEALLSIAGTKDMRRGRKCPGNFSRSKSLPVSPSFNHSTWLNKESPAPICDHTVSEETVKSNGGISIFKEKLASLFFSKSRITGREKSIPSFMDNSDVQCGGMEAIFKRNDDTSISSHPEDSRRVYCEGRSVRASTSLKKGPKQISHAKAVPCVEKPMIAVNDASWLCEGSFIGHPQALSRSSPIESLARSLSWDRTSSQASSRITLTHSTFLSKADKEEERLLFVQKLLSTSGFDNKVCSTVFAQWHSLESPLDPMLLYEFLALKEEEAKCRSRRSNQKLLFDCVNAALLDMGYTSLIGAYPWAKTYIVSSKDCQAGVAVTELMLGLVRDWYSDDGGRDSGDATNISLLVDRMVKNEVTGKGWAELMWFVIDEFGKEIGGKMLDELVEEALTDLTNSCF